MRFRPLTLLVILLSSAIMVSGANAVESIGGMSRINPSWKGDYDDMVKRRVIRVLVTYSKTFYFMDGGEQKGLSYEMIQSFEKYINRQQKKNPLKVNVFIIPVARDELLPALIEGRGDIAIANLTMTAPRLKQVAFSEPILTDVSEILVTGTGTAAIETLADTAGMEVHVRPSSSYYESLQNHQRQLKKAGLEPMRLHKADENLEDEDLLEMLNAGLITALVMDSHKAAFWKQIFKEIHLHSDLPLRQEGRIGWAFRKKSPQLQEIVNAFVRQHRKGTLLGNVLFKRYLENTRWARNALSEEELSRFNSVVGLFRKYGDRYGFDYLMLTALAYQESRLDHSTRSAAGAVGIMQLLPSTAAGKPIHIADISSVENNVHAGVKYLRYIYDRYFKDDNDIDALNKMLFTFACYNAGPSKVRSLRKQAADMQLDPNRWFHHVEIVAARRIGRETVQYVSNIFKYYIAYQLAIEKIEQKKVVLNP